jgi:hypothetical protein
MRLFIIAAGLVTVIGAAAGLPVLLSIVIGVVGVGALIGGVQVLGYRLMWRRMKRGDDEDSN